MNRHNHRRPLFYSFAAARAPILLLIVGLGMAAVVGCASYNSAPIAPSAPANTPASFVAPTAPPGSPIPTPGPLALPLELFTDVDKPAGQVTPDPVVVRTRYVNVNVDLLVGTDGPPGSSASKNKTLTLSLFPDATYTAVVDKIEAKPNGLTWIGHIDGQPKSQVTVVLENRVLSGNIRVPGHFFQIRYIGNGIHAINEINPKAYPPD